MINQVKIKYAVSQLIGASEVVYTDLGNNIEVFEFEYLGRTYTIYHEIHFDMWWIEKTRKIKTANIDSVVNFIESLGD